MNKKYLGKKALISYSQMSILILSMFAFCFIIWESESGAAGDVVEIDELKNIIVNAKGEIVGVNGQLYPSPPALNLPATDAAIAKVASVSKIPTLTADTKILSGGEEILLTKNTPFNLEDGLYVTGDGKYSFTAKELSKLPITNPPVGGTSTLSSTVSKYTPWAITNNGWWDSLLGGAEWAGIAFGAGYMIGSMLGMSNKNTMALSVSMATAFGIGKFAYTFGETGSTWFAGNGLTSGALGLAAGALVFALMYKKESYKTVEFKCLPWQAPKGGADCEKCNKDPLRPCSEYRCKSLGQLCKLQNPGTDKELCVAVDIRETDPPIIRPNETELTKGYIYTNVKTSPPSPGFEIKPTVGECIKPFTAIKFGITTDKTSRCKIDIKHTTKFDDMAYWMGGSNYFDYNHNEQFSLPGPSAFVNTSLTLENGKTMVYYIRCEGENDKPNTNPAEYMLRFCIDPSPDTTAPEIKATSILTDSCVSENTNSANVDFYTNEPAECKWSHEKRSFAQMENSMTCFNQVYQMNELMLYTCRANLTGIKRENTKFYVTCKDQPGKAENLRREMAQAQEFSLRSSNGLRINKIEPNGTIYSGIAPTSVNLYVETSSGCDNGKAVCFYSLDNQNYLEFFETNTEDGIHKQTIYTGEGRQTYYIKCVDAGGNIATNTTSVNIDVNKDGPIVARAYVANEKLNILTLRESECAYTFDNCDYAFDKAIEMPYGNETLHVAELKTDKTYYIKCRDEFTSEPAGCSIILKPQQLMQSVSLI